MGPIRRDEGADTGAHGNGAGFTSAGFEQQEPFARLGIIGFATVTPFMEMAARHIVFHTDLARLHGGGAEEQVTAGLAVVDDFIDKRIVLLGNCAGES